MRLATQKLIPLLKAHLVEHPIETAYLYGSYAKKKYTSESDIDIGVVFNSHLTASAQKTLQQKIEAELTGAFEKPVQVESIPLAPPLLKHSIVLEGKLILETNRDKRIALEVATLHEYEDNRCVFDIPYVVLKRNYEHKTQTNLTGKIR